MLAAYEICTYGAPKELAAADPTTVDDSCAPATMTVPGSDETKLINGVAVCDDENACIICGGIGNTLGDVGGVVSPPALPSVPSPATVMSHQLDNIETSVLIVGGGPHALAVLSALHERSLAFPQFTNQNVFNQRVGFDSLQKVGTGERFTHLDSRVDSTRSRRVGHA